jgi:hypothetical protein
MVSTPATLAAFGMTPRHQEPYDRARVTKGTDWSNVTMKRRRNVQPKAKPEPLPVMGKNVLFVSEESVGHVENVYQSSDKDGKKHIRKIESQAPVVDPDAKWYGDGSSDPDQTPKE